jgi:D-alanyl-lipoteichoic acid acyltransferase DltB (MBOAT superfamily)
VKLLLWANFLLLISQALTWVFSEQLTLPRLIDAIDAHLEGHPLPIATGWTVLVYGTFRYALQIAIWAHLFIGLARMAGYRLPRGSWRPLESRSLMEYFNRSHFYFKEILVDLFFIPAFFRAFRQHPRLRMFFATFMAAGVGNALWHFMDDIQLVAVEGFGGALSSFSSYLFYSLVLAVGVGLSQVRATMGYKPATTFAARLYAFFFVWSFVVLLRVFSDGTRDHSFSQRLDFLLSLFGLHLGNFL